MAGITDHVIYQGRHYKLRLIDFGEDWGGSHWVASAHLSALVWNDHNGWPSYEAQRVDELIFFFVPAHWFKLSDNDLCDMILPKL